MPVIVTKNGKQVFEHSFDVGKAMDFVNKVYNQYGSYPSINEDYEVKIDE